MAVQLVLHLNIAARIPFLNNVGTFNTNCHRTAKSLHEYPAEEAADHQFLIKLIDGRNFNKRLIFRTRSYRKPVMFRVVYILAWISNTHHILAWNSSTHHIWTKSLFTYQSYYKRQLLTFLEPYLIDNKNEKKFFIFKFQTCLKTCINQLFHMVALTEVYFHVNQKRGREHKLYLMQSCGKTATVRK